MSRYDELIDQNRKKKAGEIADRTEAAMKGEERRQRYVRAFAAALPEFHQALVKNDIWNEYEHTRKILLVSSKENIRCVHLKGWDPSEFWFTIDKAVICQDGRYLILTGAGKIARKRNGEYVYTVDGYEEINVDKLARRIYDILHLDKCDRFANYKQDEYRLLNEALKNDDADEVAFQYFATCLPK